MAQTRTLKPRLQNANELQIRGELARRGMSVTGWAEHNGLSKTHQQTVSNIMLGRATGQRCTDTKTGGTVRAVMIGLHDDFDVTWPWIESASKEEIEVYRELFKNMKARKSRKHRSHLLNPLPTTPGKNDKEKLENLKAVALLPRADAMLRKRNTVKLFRACVHVGICPVCLGPADYESVVIATRKKDGATTRTEASLKCKDGCNEWNPITSANIVGCLS